MGKKKLNFSGLGKVKHKAQELSLFSVSSIKQQILLLPGSDDSEFLPIKSITL